MNGSFRREIIRKQVDEDRSDGHAEHGDGNRHEREMIPEGDAENPCQQDFKHQSGEGDEEQSRVGFYGNVRITH